MNGEIPLPDWPDFDEADLAGLDAAALAEFRDRAIPSPAHVTTDPQRLSDERRYDVPATVICTEFTSAMLREWIGQGQAPVGGWGRYATWSTSTCPRGAGRSSPGPGISRGP